MKHPKTIDRSERIPRTKSNIVKCPKCGKVDIELDMLVPASIPESVAFPPRGYNLLHYICPGEDCRTVLRRIFQRPKQYPPSQS